jgi:hypothetical protein
MIAAHAVIGLLAMNVHLMKQCAFHYVIFVSFKAVIYFSSRIMTRSQRDFIVK